MKMLSQRIIWHPTTEAITQGAANAHHKAHPPHMDALRQTGLAPAMKGRQGRSGGRCNPDIQHMFCLSSQPRYFVQRWQCGKERFRFDLADLKAVDKQVHVCICMCVCVCVHLSNADLS
jgi:hypothetical protein